MKHQFIIIIVSLTVFSCRHQQHQVNSLNDIKGIWVIDSIEYYQEGLTKKMDLGDRIYFTEFNDFGEVVLFDKNEILVSGKIDVFKGGKVKTGKDYLFKVVYPALQVADFSDSSGKTYEINNFSKSQMQIKYKTIAWIEEKKRYDRNGKLAPRYYEDNSGLYDDKTIVYKYEKHTLFDFVNDEWNNINFLDFFQLIKDPVDPNAINVAEQKGIISISLDSL